MTLCTDAKTAVTDAMDESILEVFEMMAGATLTRQGSAERVGVEANTSDSDNGQSDVSVVMGLTGDLQGSLSITMDSAAAMRWTKSLIDYESTEIDQTVIDAVGELGNMVVGGAKRRMEGYDLTMSLPSVIRVSSACIVFRSDTTPLETSYEYEGSILTILIALQ